MEASLDLCDVCVDRKHKAVKTCLVCLASYCEAHFRLHNELNPGNKHKVIKTSGKLTDRVCSYHNKLKEFYCRDEQECICASCALNHPSHRIVSNQQERYAQEDQVLQTKEKISQRIQEIENVLKNIKRVVQAFRTSTQAAITDSERSFTEMIRSLERVRAEVKQQIQTKGKAEVQYAERVQKELQLKIEALKKRDAQLDQITVAEDDTYFLQSIPRLLKSAVYNPLPNITVRLPSLEKVKTSISKLREQINTFCKTEVARISTEVTNLKMIYIPEPFIREDFLRYFHQPAVDLNTVSRYLSLSEKNSKLVCDGVHEYPGYPERFGCMAQALCKQGLTGRSYWEIEWHDPQVYVAVSYKGVDRKGCQMSVGLGHNSQSWSLCCSHYRSYFYHNDRMTEIFEPVSSRIGVYLDHSAGILSFYNVSNIMTLLHSIKTTFTEPLYPGFWVFDGSYVRVCQYGEKVSHEVERTEDSSMVDYLGNQFTIWQYRGTL